jgi:hypothetical protein
MKLVGKLLSFVLLVASCGSSDSGLPGSGSVRPATVSCDPLAFAMLNTAGSNAKVCSATVGCIESKCADSAELCAGPDYKQQSYSGTCAAYLDCVKACNCAKACVDKCTPDSVDCAECLSLKLGMGCTLKCASEIASCGKQ